MQAAIQPAGVGGAGNWSTDRAIRVGVNTGEVVSGVWDTGSRQDVAVTGDAVNTAARIQSAAEPGEVLVGLETMRLTKRRIRYGERRELVLKGKMGTIAGYPAIGVREQFGERWETSGEATPLVGRDREMLELVDAWLRAQSGEGQLVTLVGDAGVGKSRLITELLEKVGTSVSIRVLRARCLSYGQEISLWLIADLLRGLFGIKEQDTLEEVSEKLSAGINGMLRESDKDTQAEAVDVLGEVLGLPAGNSPVAKAGAQVRRQTLIRDLRLMMRALSERAASILVLEDLHWIDEASAQVLTEVLSDVAGTTTAGAGGAPARHDGRLDRLGVDGAIELATPAGPGGSPARRSGAGRDEALAGAGAVRRGSSGRQPLLRGRDAASPAGDWRVGTAGWSDVSGSGSRRATPLHLDRGAAGSAGSFGESGAVGERRWRVSSGEALP